jgi:uncharacterized protein
VSAYRLALFPLGSVLFPGQLFPLHVFEPRYRDMVVHCLETTNEFGVVLIARGYEVGGGDDRYGVGTVARLTRVGQFPDGRYALETVGTRRFSVAQWLPDDPYPQAMVEDLDEPDSWVDPARVAAVDARVRSCVAAVSGQSDIEYDLPDDPTAASYLMSLIVPVATPDRQSLLEATDAAARIARLDELLSGWEAMQGLELDG